VLKDNVQEGDVVALISEGRLHLSAATLNLYRWLAETIINPRGATLLLLGSIPRLLLQVPALCRSTFWNLNAHSRCEQPFAQAQSPHIENRPAMANALATSMERVIFLDLFVLFCEPGRGVCGGMVPGTSTLAYADKLHLSRAGSYYLSPYLCPILNP